MTEEIVELARFCLREGVAEADLLAASQALSAEFLAGLPGFRGRDLLHLGGAEWIDVVRWSGMDEAEAAMAAFGTHPATAAYMALMDMSAPPSVEHGRLRHATR